MLREGLGITGPKLGCGEGACGACTVLIGRRAVTACITPAAAAAGQRVTTVEGLAEDGMLHPVQQAWLKAGAMQCGYCTPGWLTATAALLDRVPTPMTRGSPATDRHVSRCCTYPRIRRAVRRAAELMGHPEQLQPVPGPDLASRASWTRVPPARAGTPGTGRCGRPTRSSAGWTGWSPWSLRTAAPGRAAPAGPTRLGACRRRRRGHRVHRQGGGRPGTRTALRCWSPRSLRCERPGCGWSWAAPTSPRSTGARSAAARCPSPRRRCATPRSGARGAEGGRGRAVRPAGRGADHGRRDWSARTAPPQPATATWWPGCAGSSGCRRRAGPPRPTGRAPARRPARSAAADVVAGRKRFPADMRADGMLRGACCGRPATGRCCAAPTPGRRWPWSACSYLRRRPHRRGGAQPGRRRAAVAAIDAVWDPAPQPAAADLEDYLRWAPDRRRGPEAAWSAQGRRP